MVIVRQPYLFTSALTIGPVEINIYINSALQIKVSSFFSFLFFFFRKDKCTVVHVIRTRTECHADHDRCDPRRAFRARIEIPHELDDKNAESVCKSIGLKRYSTKNEKQSIVFIHRWPYQKKEIKVFI